MSISRSFSIQTGGLLSFTAVNIDEMKSVSLNRASDTWFYDPRLPEDLQVDDELYSNEPEVIILIAAIWCGVSTLFWVMQRF